MPGANNGLHLVLWVNQSDTYMISSPGAGYKVRLSLVLGQNGKGQNGTDKMAPIELSINQAIQLPMTI